MWGGHDKCPRVSRDWTRWRCRWFCYLLSELGKQWQLDGHILIRLGNGPLCPVPLSTIVVGPPREDGIIINTWLIYHHQRGMDGQQHHQWWDTQDSTRGELNPMNGWWGLIQGDAYVVIIYSCPVHIIILLSTLRVMNRSHLWREYEFFLDDINIQCL